MVIFITATNTNIGKTYTSKFLTQHFLEKNKKVCYLKPIETGVKNIPKDAKEVYDTIIKYDKNFNLLLKDIVFYSFTIPASPFVADKKNSIDIKHILNKIEHFKQQFDIIIIEGAGGLMVPIKKDFFMIDLIKEIEPNKTILVTPSYLGCINETLLSIEILKKYKINFNWVVNLYKQKEDFYNITLPFYKSYFNTIYYLNKKDLDEIFSS